LNQNEEVLLVSYLGLLSISTSKSFFKDTNDMANLVSQFMFQQHLNPA